MARYRLSLGALIACSFENRARLVWGVSVAGVLIILCAAEARHYNEYVISLGAANQALNEGHLDDCLAKTEAALQKNPTSSLAHALAAGAYAMKSDYKDAEAAARQALATDPENVYSEYILALAYVRTGRFENAESSIAIFNRHKVRSPALYLLVCSAEEGKGNYALAGDCFLESGQPDDAIRCFFKALRANASDSFAQCELADAYRRKGMARQAEAAAAKGRSLSQSEVGRSLSCL